MAQQLDAATVARMILERAPYGIPTDVPPPHTWTPNTGPHNAGNDIPTRTPALSLEDTDWRTRL